MRGKALAIFTVAPFAVPAIGPIVSGYIVVADLSWQWLFWILTIFVNIPRMGFSVSWIFVRKT
jgi:MFS family permease